MSASASALTGGSTAHAEEHQQTPTGLGNEWFGMILFLVSEAILFGAIFAQYFYSRVQAPAWPPAGMEKVPAFPLALILTLILVVSGFTAHAALNAVRRDDRDAVAAWLAATILLGVVFLAGQAFEYAELLALLPGAHAEPFGIDSGLYGSVFYTLTGLHGLHVTAGVLLLVAVLARALMGHFTSRNHFALEGTILYWHFVDIVWILLYVTLYLF